MNKLALVLISGTLWLSIHAFAATFDTVESLEKHNADVMLLMQN